MKKLGFFLPVAIFLGVVIYMAIGLTLNPQELPSTLIGKPVPAFDMPAIQGFEEGFSSEDLKGQVTLINVFGSWCVACVDEHPVLNEITRQKLVPIYGVDWKDAPGAGAQWLAERGNPYLKIGDDADGRVAIDLGVTGAPESFLVDKNGIIRYKRVGIITWDLWKTEIYPKVKELREE